MELAIGIPGDCGSWHTPTKLSGNIVTIRAIRSFEMARPFGTDRLVADVVTHACGARREDRHVGAALAQQTKLVRLDRVREFVIRYAGIERPGRIPTLGIGDLALPELVVSGRLRGVVAVAINDHGCAPDETERATSVVEIEMTIDPPPLRRPRRPANS